jgi:pSer/pThr/pTyr-binding forkhead associated (FHA) protein
MAVCPKCEKPYEIGQQVCESCGEKLPGGPSTSQDEDTIILNLLQAEPGAPSAPSGPARIWLLDPLGDQVEKSVEISKEVTVIGRRSDCDIVLPSNTVSRRHAQIRKEGDRALLSDLGSTNGTLLNGEAVIGEEPLGDRDEIVVGTFKLIFRQR